jgi:hypothetical protein
MTDIVSLQSGAQDDTIALDGGSLAGWLGTPRELELILLEDCKVDELNGLLRERDVERAEPRRQLEQAAQEAPRSVRKHDIPILATSPLWPEFVA